MPPNSKFVPYQMPDSFDPFLNGFTVGEYVRVRGYQSRAQIVAIMGPKVILEFAASSPGPRRLVEHVLNIMKIPNPEKFKAYKEKAYKEKSEEINLKALDPLILNKESKDEIIALLLQQSHKDKIFEEWGLGEVIEYGRGMTMLFHGLPGTGKTWAAHCIAKALATKLMVLAAADIQSQEPGAANRNLQQAFKTAKEKEEVLFIDECDSLITQRNGIGMILSSEINTLLTEIEKFEGVCILATNRIGAMDEALERRIALIVEFPEPDFNTRLEIWQKLLPKKLPIHKEVEIKKLAENKLTGGQIKNAVLHSARIAASEKSKEVMLVHFERAIKKIHAGKNLMGKERVAHQVDYRVSSN